MDTSEYKDIPDNILSSRRSDPSLLVDSLRENIAIKIDEINKSADLNIKRMDDDLRKEIDEFRKLNQKRHEEYIKYETGKSRNLFSINKKKQNLDGIESFIKRVIDEVTGSIRKDLRYIDFLNGCVLSALENVKGGSATILVAAEDLVYSQNIINKINISSIKLKFSISGDERIKMGGAMVIDDEAEVIFNNTIERIVYRKNDEIRREIVKSIKEFKEHEA